MRAHEDIVGVIPAAGTANRLGRLPCSKELLPVGFHRGRKGEHVHPKVVSHYLMERMHLAKVSKVYFILRQGKWDIPAYFGNGEMVNIPIAYLVRDLSYGVPFTLDQAYPFITNSIVVFGFPDVIFKPNDAFLQLLKKQSVSNADIVLGLFEAQRPQKIDMVELDDKGNIIKIDIKPASTHLRYTWIIAVWTPRFTEFMHKYVQNHLASLTTKADWSKEPKEVFVGDVIQAAVYSDIKIEKVIFSEGQYLDIGTPGDLAKAAHSHLEKFEDI